MLKMPTWGQPCPLKVTVTYGGSVWRVVERFAVRLVVSVRALPLVKAVSAGRG